MRQPSRQRVSTGSPFEPKVGISRAVRSGSVIAVTGTAPLGPDGKKSQKAMRRLKLGGVSKLSSPPLKD